MLCKSYQVHLLCGPMWTPWRWGILLFLLLPLTISQSSFPGGSDGKNFCLPMQKTQVQSLGGEDSLQKWRATHSSIFFSGEFHGQKSLVCYTLYRVTKSRTWLSNYHIHTPVLKSFCLPETKYLQIFVIHLLSSVFLFLAIWAVVPPGSLLILHSFNTLSLNMVSVTGMVPSPGDTDKHDYLPLEVGKALWDFFLFEVYTFFWGLIRSVTFIRIVSLNLDSHAHNDFYANFPSPALFLEIKL